MIYVILDSSATYLTVAIASKEAVIESISYEAWQCQSEKMIPELEELLNRHGFVSKDIVGVIVGIGPGSYTGIRIALTTAKILALSLNIPVYPVSSLHILKDGDKPTITLMNARSGRSYFAVYQGEKCLVPDQTKVNEDVLAYINEHPDYSIKGELAYLGLKDNVGDIAKEAHSLINSLEACEGPLALKPVYMRG